VLVSGELALSTESTEGAVEHAPTALIREETLVEKESVLPKVFQKRKVNTAGHKELAKFESSATMVIWTILDRR